MGGFGSMVLTYLMKQGLLRDSLAIDTLCLPDRFIDQADPNSMYAEAGLRSTDIHNACIAALGRNDTVVLRRAIQS